MFFAAIFASVLALSGAVPDKDPDKGSGPEASAVCQQTPSACRLVPPFSLTFNGDSHPIDLGAPQPWIEDGRLILFPGESVLVAIKPDGGLRVVSSQPADAVLDDAMTTKMAAVFAPGGTGATATEADVVAGQLHLKQETPSQAIRVTFRQAAGNDAMLLTIQNGYGGRLSYNAGMLSPSAAGLQWRVTSVCTVRPDIYGMEHWPHPIVSVSLGAFSVDPNASLDQILCR
jgi:hypothetical protein